MKKKTNKQEKKNKEEKHRRELSNKGQTRKLSTAGHFLLLFDCP